MYLWFCDGCLPENVEQSTIGGVFHQRCSVCQRTFEREYMKHVLKKNVPPRLLEKIRG